MEKEWITGTAAVRYVYSVVWMDLKACGWLEERCLQEPCGSTEAWVVVAGGGWVGEPSGSPAPCHCCGNCCAWWLWAAEACVHPACCVHIEVLAGQRSWVSENWKMPWVLNKEGNALP